MGGGEGLRSCSSCVVWWCSKCKALMVGVGEGTAAIPPGRTGWSHRWSKDPVDSDLEKAPGRAGSWGTVLLRAPPAPSRGPQVSCVSSTLPLALSASLSDSFYY